VIRIGVLYVKQNQTSEMDILSNSSGSSSYNAFLSSLGWEVDIKTHHGFLGGLNEETDGKSSIFYCDEKYEVMFHVVTMMPQDLTKDDKHVRRKRHVGNDHVHIVWSEHKRDYNPDVIVSQFNDAHLIVYPLQCGLYRIQTYRKQTIPEFGPLTDGMVLSNKILGPLIRITAINANRCVRSTQPAYEHPFILRKKFVKQLADRHKFPEPMENMLSRYYPRGNDLEVNKIKVLQQELYKFHPYYNISPDALTLYKKYHGNVNNNLKTRVRYYSKPIPLPTTPFKQLDSINIKEEKITKDEKNSNSITSFDSMKLEVKSRSFSVLEKK